MVGLQQQTTKWGSSPVSREQGVQTHPNWTVEHLNQKNHPIFSRIQLSSLIASDFHSCLTEVQPDVEFCGAFVACSLTIDFLSAWTNLMVILLRSFSSVKCFFGRRSQDLFFSVLIRQLHEYVGVPNNVDTERVRILCKDFPFLHGDYTWILSTINVLLWSILTLIRFSHLFNAICNFPDDTDKTI